MKRRIALVLLVALLLSAMLAGAKARKADRIENAKNVTVDGEVRK